MMLMVGGSVNRVIFPHVPTTELNYYLYNRLRRWCLFLVLSLIVCESCLSILVTIEEYPCSRPLRMLTVSRWSSWWVMFDKYSKPSLRWPSQIFLGSNHHLCRAHFPSSGLTTTFWLRSGPTGSFWGWHQARIVNESVGFRFSCSVSPRSFLFWLCVDGTWDNTAS